MEIGSNSSHYSKMPNSLFLRFISVCNVPRTHRQMGFYTLISLTRHQSSLSTSLISQSKHFTTNISSWGNSNRYLSNKWLTSLSQSMLRIPSNPWELPRTASAAYLRNLSKWQKRMYQAMRSASNISRFIVGIQSKNKSHIWWVSVDSSVPLIMGLQLIQIIDVPSRALENWQICFEITFERFGIDGVNQSWADVPVVSTLFEIGTFEMERMNVFLDWTVFQE